MASDQTSGSNILEDNKEDNSVIKDNSIKNMSIMDEFRSDFKRSNKKYFEQCRYIGFDRDFLLKEIMKRSGNDRKSAMKVASWGFLRGNNINKANNDILAAYDKLKCVKSKKQAADDELFLTPVRLSQVFIDVMFRTIWLSWDCKKRIEHELPAIMQNSSVSGLHMDDDLWNLYQDWSEEFTTKIGGIYSPSILDQCRANARYVMGDKGKQFIIISYPEDSTGIRLLDRVKFEKSKDRKERRRMSVRREEELKIMDED